jgi:hypothetical protein
MLPLPLKNEHVRLILGRLVPILLIGWLVLLGHEMVGRHGCL